MASLPSTQPSLERNAIGLTEVLFQSIAGCHSQPVELARRWLDVGLAGG